VSASLPLLGSDKDGEVVAAARAIGRTLRADGRDWHSLVASIRTKPARTQPTDGHWSGLHWRSAAGFCQQHAEWLNAWEAQFIDSLLTRRYPLTAKQKACLENIRQKVLDLTNGCHAQGAAWGNT
jgi:hypothetical protein